MSLNKAIEHGKEHRRQYTGSKAIDKTCRNHGSCEWCIENRTYKSLKLKEKFKLDLQEWENGDEQYRQVPLESSI